MKSSTVLPLIRPKAMDERAMPDDHALMVRMGQGDEKAYRMLVERHLPRAVRFARTMLGNRSDAEDVAQEAFFKVWNEAPRWQPIALFSTWFYRVLYNLCMDQVRKRKVVHVEIDESLPDDGQSPEQQVSEYHQAKRVQAAIAQLPERQRAAITLFHYEELSQTETAQALGISESALESLLFRARQALKEALHELS